jgi:hypothetical protein
MSDRSAKADCGVNICCMMISAEKVYPVTANGVEIESTSGYQSGVNAD